MCCDGWDYSDGGKIEPSGVCRDCGAGVDEDGDAMAGCHYSEIICETCGDAPCELRC